MTKEVPRTSVLRDAELSISDATLIARLRMIHEWKIGKEAAARIEALIADLARSTRMIAKMVPLSADGNYVFWDGVGDIELDHNGELRETIEALIAENKRLGQQCEGLMQAGMNNGQALILAEAKLAECEARLGKAVEALEEISEYDTGATAGLAYTAKHHLAEIKKKKTK